MYQIQRLVRLGNYYLNELYTINLIRIIIITNSIGIIITKKKKVYITMKCN